MKKVIFAILISLVSLTASAQQDGYRLDTIQIKNFSLRAQDWSYVIGQFYAQRSDTVTNDFIDHYRTKIKAMPAGSGWNTVVTVDSIPGHIAFRVYMMYKTAPAGETELLGNNIATVISGITNTTFAAARAAYDAIIANSFQTKRNDGKRFSIGK